MTLTERVDAVNRPPRRIRYGWTLYSTEWDSIPVDVIQREGWESTALSRFLKASVPQQAGVYMMCVKPPSVFMSAEPFSDLVEVIYVGKSKNLRRRYGQHLDVPSPKVRMARNTYSDSLRFWYLRLATDRISLVESILIGCLGPPANDLPGEVQRLEVGSTVPAQSTKGTVV